MKNYIQFIFAQKNPIHFLVSRLSAEKHLARFLLSRFLRMTRLCRFLHIKRRGYLLKFSPSTLAMSLWVDPDYSASDSEVIRNLLREGDSYVDVGANIGHLTIEAAFAVGDTGMITAFEAHPHTAEYLRENLELNNLTKVRVAQLAVGDGFRWVTFSNIDSDEQNSVLPSGPGITVPMVRLDAFFAGEAITLLKVDVEGWEKFVFLGAGRILEDVSFVYFECWDEHFQRSGYSFLDIHDILSSSGFTIASVKDAELLPIQSDSTFPKCINLFAFKDMEQFVVRMGLRT
jgi:FkbM family methyltransferase